MKSVQPSVTHAVAACLFLAFAGTSSFATTYYATPEGGGDGSGWASPATLAEAVAAATTAGDEVLLKAGEYTVSAQIAIAQPITVKGGLAGTDDTTLAADPVSTLNGFDNTSFENIFYLTTTTGATTTNAFSRLCFTRAYRRGLYKTGNAALVCDACRFYRNGVRYAVSSADGGGAKVNSAGTAIFRDCLFDSNAHTNWFSKNVQLFGSGVYAYKATALVLDNCGFYTNCIAASVTASRKNINQDTQRNGGTLYVQSTPVYASGCSFVGNLNNGRGTYGNTVYVYDCTGGAFSNCLFYGNRSLDADSSLCGFGGPLNVSLANAACTLDVYGCTFAYNYCYAATCSAGLHVNSGKVVVRNSIFYGNHLEESKRTAGYGSDITVAADGWLDIDYSLISGEGTSYLSCYTATHLTQGEHVVYGDPCFGTTLAVAKAAVGGHDGTPDLAAICAFDLHENALGSGYSRAIDGGTGAYAAEPAPNGGARNLGVYGNTASAATSTLGVPAIKDDEIAISFASDTKPTVSVTLAGATAYNAWVRIQIATNDLEQLGATAQEVRILAGVQSGETVTLSGLGLYPPGLTLHARVTIDAPGLSQPIVQTASKTITGTLPYHYGHGGGANVIHVRAGADGLQNGANWTDAFADFNDAIPYITSDKTEVWIAGTLTPTMAPKTLTATAALAIRGGFTGSEDSIDDRAAGALSTIDGQDTFSCMVLVNGQNIPVTVERMVFRRGYSRGLSKTGHGNLNVVDCRLFSNGQMDNSGSTALGRGLYVASGNQATVSITNSEFRGNFYRKGGGGSCQGSAIYATGIKRLVVDDTLFVTNAANPSCGLGEDHSGHDYTDGSGLWLNGVPGTFRNCRFTGNRGATRNKAGGLILLNGAAGGSAFTNCVFAGNMTCYASGDSASTIASLYYSPRGGAVVVDLSTAAGTVDFEKCTIAYNTACSYYSPGGLDVIKGTVGIRNSIVYGNVKNANSQTGSDIIVWPDGTLDISHSWLTAEDGSTGRPTSGTVFVKDGGTLTCDNLLFGDPQFVTPQSEVDAHVKQDGYYTYFLYSTAADVAFFANIDVHLCSPGGRYDNDGVYHTEDVRVSTAIDKGDADDPAWANEPTPNGERVNLGGYAGTRWASKTLEAQPAIKDNQVTVTFPNGFARPTISFTMAGEGAYSADVAVCCTTNDPTAADYDITNRLTGVVNGTVVTIPLTACFVAGDTLYWRVTVTADKAQDVVLTGTATITGATPAWYGKGGGEHVVHVWPDVPGGARSGADWWDAYATVDDALAALTADKNEIWLVAGTNQLPQSFNNLREFPIVVRGGFTGYENTPAERPAGSRSLLSRTEESVIVIANTSGVTLDGFVIREGVMHGINKSGTGNLTVLNSRLCENGRYLTTQTAAYYGGGAYLAGGTATFSNCLFDANSQTNFYNRQTTLTGGGIYASGLTRLTLDDCTFMTNGQSWATSLSREIGQDGGGGGGALYAVNSPVTARNCRFLANRTVGRTYNTSKVGCAVAVEGASGGSAFTNCLFVGNETTKTGNSRSDFGAALGVRLSDAAATVDVIGCTIAYNYGEIAATAAGLDVFKGTVRMRDSIVYGNHTSSSRSVNYGSDIAVKQDGYLDLDYSLVTASDIDHISSFVAANATLGDHVVYGDPLFGTDYDTVTNLVIFTDAFKGYMYSDEALDKILAFDLHENAGADEGEYSRAIDTADVASAYANEPSPNGNRRNLGCYGDTATAATSQDGTPEIAAEGIALAFDAETHPTVTVTLGGTGTFNANVIIEIATNDFRQGDVEAAERIAAGGLQRGETLVLSGSGLYEPGSTLYVRVTLVAGGTWSTSIRDTSGTVTGERPFHYGHGGGANVMHVRMGAAGLATGANWTDAYPDLLTALTMMTAEKTEIWIAGAITSTMAVVTFTPSVPLVIRGGFRGDEDTAAQRRAGWYATLHGQHQYDMLWLDNAAANPVTVERVIFARGVTHGLYKKGAGNLTVTDCKFHENSWPSTSSTGRGICLEGGTVVSVTNCEFRGNFMEGGGSSSSKGGGISASGVGRLYIDDSVFVTNGCNPLCNHSSLMSGRDDCGGGVLLMSGVPVTARNCVFLANRTPIRTHKTGSYGGGAILVGGAGSAFTNCVFAGNESLYAEADITSNGTCEYGGAVVVDASGSVDFEHCTIAYNIGNALHVPGGLCVISGNVRMHNSIIASNMRGPVSDVGSDIAVKGGTLRLSYCLLAEKDGATGKPTATTVSEATSGLITYDNVIYGEPLFMSTWASVTNFVVVNGNYTYFDYDEKTSSVSKRSQEKVALRTQIDVHGASRAGYYDAEGVRHYRRGREVSPAIDGGDPASAWSNEPEVPGIGTNGKRANLGAYGNTREAAMKLFPGAALTVR